MDFTNSILSQYQTSPFMDSFSDNKSRLSHLLAQNLNLSIVKEPTSDRPNKLTNNFLLRLRSSNSNLNGKGTASGF